MTAIHINELPLFLREGGQNEIELRRKELKVYLKLLKLNPRHMIEDRTFIALNPHTLNPCEVGEKEANDIKNWWNAETQNKVCIWLDTNDHKCNGKFGNWSCGDMGSRWADCEINGRNCRLAYYTRKYNPTTIQNI